MKDDEPIVEGTPQADTDSPAEFEEAGSGEAGTDDFAARNVIMSNALPPDASASAGAVSRETDPYLEPRTDEERLPEDGDAGPD